MCENTTILLDKSLWKGVVCEPEREEININLYELIEKESDI